MTKANAPPVVPKPRWVALFAVLAGSVLLLAACGGGPGKSDNAAVADLGATTTAKASSSQGGGTSEMPACARGPDTRGAGWVCVSPDFAHCMRTHGVPNFPEPNDQGWAVSSGINTTSSRFQADSNHCFSLLHIGGGPATPVLNTQALAQTLRFSQCMRSHGIADFADPGSSANGVGISTQAGKAGDLDPKNPRFQGAARACRGK
jgi:hypothetical protein